MCRREETHFRVLRVLAGYVLHGAMLPRRGLVYHHTPRQSVTRGSVFRPATPGEAWEAILLPLAPHGVRAGGRRDA